MSENLGGPSGPPDPFNMYNLIHRGEMPTLEVSTRKNFKALKTAYFTHPSDSEKYFVIGGDAIRQMNIFEIGEGLEMISKEEFLNVTVLNSGDVMVKTKNIQQIEALKSTKSFGHKKSIVSISENGALNQSYAIIRVKEIMKLETDLIAENLKMYNVVQVQRLKRKVGNTWVDTPTHVLTFNRPIIPAEIKVGFIHAKTEIFIPSPFRCASCQKLGHTRKRCDSKKNKPTCVFCGEESHLYGPCLPPKCVNCRGGHPSNSKTCPKYIEEREINAIRVTLRIPYKLARKELYNRRGTGIRSKSFSGSSSSIPSTSQSTPTQAHSKSFVETVKFKSAEQEKPNSSKKLHNVIPTLSKITKITKKEFKRNIQREKIDEIVANIAEDNLSVLPKNKPTDGIIKKISEKLLSPENYSSNLIQNIETPIAQQHGISLPCIPFLSQSPPHSSPIPFPSPSPPIQEDAEPPDIEISDVWDSDQFMN